MCFDFRGSLAELQSCRIVRQLLSKSVMPMKLLACVRHRWTLTGGFNIFVIICRLHQKVFGLMECCVHICQLHMSLNKRWMLTICLTRKDRFIAFFFYHLVVSAWLSHFLLLGKMKTVFETRKSICIVTSNFALFCFTENNFVLHSNLRSRPPPVSDHLGLTVWMVA